MRPVIVLRPEPGASETVRRARERGLDAVAIPLFEIEPVAWSVPDPDDFDALLLTSANAPRHGGEGLHALRSLPVHAVGQATADIARQAGFAVATVGDGGVDALLDTIDPQLRLLHLCGDHRREPMTNHPITAIPVYRSNALSQTAEIPKNSIAMIHSPRAGWRLAELASDRSAIAIAAISDAAAKAAGSGWASVDVAEQPSDDALLALAARLCNKPAAE